MKVLVYRNGLVKLSEQNDERALTVADVPNAKLIRGIVGVVARHAYNNVDLLCPGVPEADNDEAAYQAVTNFEQMIDVRLKRAALDPEYMSIYVGEEVAHG